LKQPQIGASQGQQFFLRAASAYVLKNDLHGIQTQQNAENEADTLHRHAKAGTFRKRSVVIQTPDDISTPELLGCSKLKSFQGSKAFRITDSHFYFFSCLSPLSRDAAGNPHFASSVLLTLPSPRTVFYLTA